MQQSRSPSPFDRDQSLREDPKLSRPSAACGNPLAASFGGDATDGQAEPAVVQNLVDPVSGHSVWSPDHIARCHALLGEAVCDRLAIYSLPPGFVLTVIVPIYNEVKTIDVVIARLRATAIPMQIVLVDDGSTDGTAQQLQRHASGDDVVIISHPKNRGKGAAIRTALDAARGEIVVIQDADQEYDPQDFRFLMQPILDGRADVVYGTRYGHVDRQVSPLWHEWVNQSITGFANLCLGVRLNDIETCYKMATRRAWEMISPSLRENRFGIEIELTARWVHSGMRLMQRPIRYQHRWFADGKKIGWRDGVAAMGCIIRYALLRR